MPASMTAASVVNSARKAGPQKNSAAPSTNPTPKE